MGTILEMRPRHADHSTRERAAGTGPAEVIVFPRTGVTSLCGIWHAPPTETGSKALLPTLEV
ncbi:MAG: hypothetical protein JWN71_4520 [Xanthobacteraceae bacterium]|jgi:hypothetical protein|nr:hypothetical protein [Xanthobacteraceae bacterium]